MRNKRLVQVLSMTAILAIGLTVAIAQPGGGGGKRGNRGGSMPGGIQIGGMQIGGGQQGGDQGGRRNGRGGQMDPNMIFNFMSGGQDFIDVNNFIAQSSQRDPGARERIEAFLQQQGITNGQITRDQFAGYMQQRMAGGTGNNGRPGGQGAQLNEDRIKQRFNEADLNHDGVLQPNEMTDNLKEELDKWDKNKNGVIEYDEYRDYFMARMQYRMDQNADRRGQNGQQYDEFQLPQKEEKKQVVYRRASDLPKELPQWFFQIPHRNPGQIALVEWRNAERTVDEFRKYDRNADGFITVEEVLSVEKTNAGGRRGGDYLAGGADSEEPQEETLVVLAGPGAISDDTPIVSLAMGMGMGANGNFGNGRGNRGMQSGMGNMMANMGNMGGGNRGNFGNMGGGNNRGGQQPGGRGGQQPGGRGGNRGNGRGGNRG